MTGLLDSDDIQQLFGDVFSDIYGDGELIRVDMVRGPGGVMTPTEQPPVPVKVQTDRCDHAMRDAPGYSDTDVKLLILQSGVSGRKPNTDDIVVARGQRWKISGVTEDPARSYWSMRGIRQATGQ